MKALPVFLNYLFLVQAAATSVSFPVFSVTNHTLTVVEEAIDTLNLGVGLPFSSVSPSISCGGFSFSATPVDYSANECERVVKDMSDELILAPPDCEIHAAYENVVMNYGYKKVADTSLIRPSVIPSIYDIGSRLLEFYDEIGHSEVVLIYEETSYGYRMNSATSNFLTEGGLYLKTFGFSSGSNDDLKLALQNAKNTGIKSFYMIVDDLDYNEAVIAIKEENMDGSRYLWGFAPTEAFGFEMIHNSSNDIHGSFRLSFIPFGNVSTSEVAKLNTSNAVELYAYDATVALGFSECSGDSDRLGNISFWGATGYVDMVEGKRNALYSSYALDNILDSGTVRAITWDLNQTSMEMNRVEHISMIYATGTSTPPSTRGEDFFGGTEQGYHLGDFKVAICWFTYTNPQHPKYGIAQQANNCPNGLDINFLKEPPSTLISGDDYDVSYEVTLGRDDCPNTIGSMCDTENQVILTDGYHIPHANIHSCSSSVQLCTPAIKNDGTLATHTPALKSSHVQQKTIFNSTVNLDREGSYTVIAHGRAYTSEIKWDVAKAVKVVVTIDNAIDSRGYHLGEFDFAVCWRTGLDVSDPLYGQTRQLNQCPEGLDINFDHSLPDKLIENEVYPLNYTVELGVSGSPNTIGSSKKAIYPVNGKFISHVNLHICSQAVAFCTPGIKNDGTLSTHTPALSVVDESGNGLYHFNQDVQMGKGLYTLIAHARVFTDEGAVKYDIAKAMRIEFTEPPEKLVESKGYHLGDFKTPVCWRTHLNSEHPLAGVPTQLNACPLGLDVDIKNYAPVFYRNEVLNISYEVKLGDVEYPNTIGNDHLPVVKASSGNFIDHVNVHFCYSNIAFCTPLIAKGGNLSTHTQTLQVQELDPSGNYKFLSEVTQLRPDSYTFITHARVYTDGGMVKYDIAKAAQVVVLEVKPDEDFSRIPSTVRAAVNSLAGINWFVCCSFFLWVYVNKRESIVMFSQPIFLFTVILGGMVSTSTIIFLGFEDSPEDLAGPDGGNSFADAGCTLSVWTYCLGFNLTLATLLCKIWRVLKIFNNKTMSVIKISNAKLFRIIGGCMSVDALILLIWQATDPLTYVRQPVQVDAYGNVLKSTGLCQSDNAWAFIAPILVFHLCILAYGNLLAYKSAGANTMLNESKYVAVAMISNLQVLAISIPVMVIVADDPPTNYFIRGGIVFLNDLSVLCFIFLPKIYMHTFNREMTQPSVITQATAPSTSANQPNNSFKTAGSVGANDGASFKSKGSS